MSTINWGIISTAKIGVEQVIPAIQEASNCRVQAIASRTASKARQAAQQLEIPDWYDSYDALLADEQIDAIYNPLPNHLHVPYSINALEADKHVLCEKPIALDAEEAKSLQQAAEGHPKLNVMEAFMYRFHPQWIRAKELVDQGAIGDLQTVHSFFSYYNDDADDIRNNPDMGGGGLMDIGCYCISLSRYLFDAEPRRVQGQWKIDPRFDTDYLASGMLDFGSGTATFTCATQTAPHQQVNIVGTDGRIVIDIPFNAPPNGQTQIHHYHRDQEQTISFEPVNQYTLQAHAFAKTVIENTPVPTPLTDAIANMKVIDTFKEVAGN
ncbi:MAG: Gfo/Idh/MocA family oxidoreductase [Fodinibius sp.]|nr:Gfo/Idh/MocA family oxidoreductase [Fodinibius sp.]